MLKLFREQQRNRGGSSVAFKTNKIKSRDSRKIVNTRLSVVSPPLRRHKTKRKKRVDLGTLESIPGHVFFVLGTEHSHGVFVRQPFLVVVTGHRRFAAEPHLVDDNAERWRRNEITDGYGTNNNNVDVNTKNLELKTLHCRRPETTQYRYVRIEYPWSASLLIV